MIQDPAPSVPGPFGPRGLRILGAILLLLAAVLPPERLVDALSARYRTVAGFRGDYVRGLHALRAALAFAGLAATALPALLSRARLTILPATRPERADLAAAAALVLPSLLAALPGLCQSWQDDEWRVVEQYVRHGPGVILTRNNEGDNQILHSLLVWPFVAVFGTTEIAARMPVWLAGSFGGPLLFLLLRARGAARPPAAVASLLFGLSPFLLQYLHESRAYALLAPGLLALLLLQPALLRGDARAWAASAALAAAVVALHLFATPAVAAVLLSPLAGPGHRRPEIAWRLVSALLTACAASLLLYAPVLPQMFAAAAAQKAYPADSLSAAGIVGRLFVADLPPWTALPFLALLAAGVPASRTTALALLASLGLQTTLLALAASEIAPRFLVPSLALAWVLIGETLGRLWPRRTAAVSVTLLLLSLSVGGVLDYYRQGNRDYRGLAAGLERLRRPGERVGGRVDARPITVYLSPPPLIADDNRLRLEAPEWLVLVSENLRQDPEFAAWLGTRYEERLRLPSLRGALVALRKREP